MPSDYSTLLARARSKLQDATATHERFTVPAADVMYMGKTTVIRNFAAVADQINREPDQLLAYLLREVGMAGTLDGPRVIFKGKVDSQLIQGRIKEFVEAFVLCGECNRPDTKLVKDGRTTILTCDACGAHRPVAARKLSRPEGPSSALRVGLVIDVQITDLGQKGDGVAKYGTYTVFVPGTTKGASVKVRIDHIKDNMAFGTVVTE